MKKSRFTITTTHYILLSFLTAILVGSVLLTLPISSASGQATPFIDALFTATTATCVTGLVVVPTVTAWSLFGHIVILVLIQIGGLGIITIMASITVFLHKRMGLADRLLLQDAFNLNTLSGLEVFVKKVIKGTFLIEGIGACLYMIVFVPQFGLKGIWISIFTSISAFCNAGIDIIGENSLCDYATHPIINLVTSLLIIFGGLGYIVWWDVIRLIKGRLNGKKTGLKSLTLHSKIVLTTTSILIFGGGLLFFLFEYNNPLTIKDLSIYDKIQISVFQSVTTRTAGFASVPQEDLTNASAAVSILLMIVGGSPVGTAGGMKTVTVAVLACSAFATIRNKNSPALFGRRISEGSIKKAVAVAVAFLAICAASTVLLMATSNASALDAIYETVSATATVGLSRNLTATLNTFGKLIIIVTMYFGRVGPISLAVALGSKNESQNVISEPTEDISIG